MGRRDYYHLLRNFRSDGQTSVSGFRTFIQWTVRKWSDGTPDPYDNPIGARYILSNPADKLVRAGGTLVTIAEPPTVRPKDGRAVFFVVEPDRARLADLVQRLRDGRLGVRVGAVRPLTEAAAAFAPDRRIPGRTIIRVTED